MKVIARNLPMMKIIVRYIPGQKGYLSKSWEISQDICYQLSDGNTILIKKGFRFDMSSVPRLLWALFPPFGDFLPASLVHDWLYINKYRCEELGAKKARLFADKEMLRISNEVNKNKLDNYIRYYAVRLFGSIVYNKRK